MKKLLLVLAMLFSFNFAFADQLAWITLEQAQKAVEILSKEKQVIDWCACCEDGSSEKILVNLKGVRYEEVTGYSLYKVIISGIDSNGNDVEKAVDLAYIHIKGKDNKAHCVGTMISKECDPCTKPFKWISSKKTKKSRK